MLSPRYQKIIRDLLSNKARTILVILAISVGVFAFGSVFITQDVLVANMTSDYYKSQPSTVSLYLSEFDETLVRFIKDQPGVKDAAGKAGQTVKLLLPSDREEILSITGVPDSGLFDLNLIVPEKGDWPPKTGEIILERSSLAASHAQIGDSLTVKAYADRFHKLVLSGTVYDNSAFPYMFTNQLNGFVSFETLGLLGFSKNYNRLEIATDSEIKNLSDSEKLAYDLTEILEDRGIKVSGSRVFRPNEHWAENNSKAFTAILSVIGVFSLILSGFLVVNTISALLSQQKKQIGVMKAIGASGGQIIFLYLIMVGIYGILSLIIALPVGMILGYLFTLSVANFLNLNINLFYLPRSVFLLQVLAALVVPLFAALIPVIGGARRSVRLSLSDYESTRKAGITDLLLLKIHGFTRPTLISIRNTFRKKGRLVLTMGTLIVAGALFMSVINTRSAMVRELERILQMFDFEISLTLNKDYAVESTIKRLMELPHVTAVEGRNGIMARRIKPDESEGNEFRLSGLPPDTVFSHPVLLSGRWLNNNDTNQVVLSSAYARDNPDLNVGDELSVSAENNSYRLEIVGIIAMSGDQKLGFMNFKTIAVYKDQVGLASAYFIKTEPNDGQTQSLVANQAEDRLRRGNIKVSGKETRDQIFSGASSQFNFMVFFLLAMAVMVAVVGGLGLAGTMSLNVMERTREIGIMRSIGAGNSIIRRLVLTEGLFIGFLSWLFAIPLSLPLTYGFAYAIGNAFFERTLVFSIIPVGMVIWLFIVVIIAIIASILPANRAAKMSISETLSYE